MHVNQLSSVVWKMFVETARSMGDEYCGSRDKLFMNVVIKLAKNLFYVAIWQQTSYGQVYHFLSLSL